MQQPAGAGGGAGSQYMTQMLGIGSSDHMPPPSSPIIQSKHGQSEAASPITTRLPAVRNFEELLPPVAVAGFPDEDALAGEEAERGPPGNRWPRQETVALLKIRSDMDGNFRDSTLKGPLWEEVSRKLGEMGYNRSAKKCKEKFENVHKYYKRTKEGRAGRQDGKSYRFFSQLEALHTAAGGSGGGISSSLSPTTYPSAPLPATPISVGSPMVAPSRSTLPPPGIPAQLPPPPVVLPEGISFSTSESEEEDDQSEEEEGTEAAAGGRKRKRAGGGGISSSKKIMSFFEGLIKQVMERQEAMQQRFLETIEKREQDRMIRDEAWKRQEMARLTREHELMAQERAMAASRDAAVIGFLQKITGQSIPTSTAPTTPTASTPITPLSHPTHTINFQQPTHEMIASTPVKRQPLPTPTSAAEAVLEKESLSVELSPAAKAATTAETTMMMTGSFDPASSSRWPKAEVHALIKIRSGMEGKYQEAGPKGPLWEEISAEMRRVGYNRSSKRCKEKWENINKYFKKVKESNKKRPEDAKTCPYFHQLDALYKKKHIAGSSAAGEIRHDVSSLMSPPLPDSGTKDENNNICSHNSNKTSDGGSNVNAGSNLQVQTTNGDLPPSFFQGEAGAIKKPEDIMKELMEHHHQQSVMDDYDSDNLDEVDDDEDNEGEDDHQNDDDKNMGYNIQFQRPGSSNGGAPGASPATTTAGSFLAMVK